MATAAAPAPASSALAWFDFAFQPGLLPAHVQRLRADKASRPSHRELLKLLLTPVTRGQHGLALAAFSLAHARALLAGGEAPGPLSDGVCAPVRLNARCSKLLQLAATLALALEYDLAEVRASGLCRLLRAA